MLRPKVRKRLIIGLGNFTFSRDSVMDARIETIVTKLRTGDLRTGQIKYFDETKFRSYLSTVFSSERDGDLFGSWLDCISAGDMCDDKLMVAGIAALRMPPNVIVIPPFRAQSFFYQAEYDVRRDIKISSLHLIERTESERVQRREHTSGLVTTVLLPITFSMHWGIVIAKYDVSDNTGYVMWGDSLGYKPPAGVLNVMRTFMAKTFPSIEWVVCENFNYILDRLKFGRQLDAYSCGFYVLNAIATFSSSRGIMPHNAFSQYDPLLTERIRWCCIVTYVQTFSELSLKKSGKVINDADIVLELTARVRDGGRKPSSDVPVAAYELVRCTESSGIGTKKQIPLSAEAFPRIRLSTHLGSVMEREEVYSLSSWLHSLAGEGEHFSSPVVRYFSPREKRFAVKVRLQCVQRRRSCKCPHVLTARRLRYGSGGWVIERKGKHTHGTLDESCKSKRNEAMLATIAKLDNMIPSVGPQAGPDTDQEHRQRYSTIQKHPNSSEEIPSTWPNDKKLTANVALLAAPVIHTASIPSIDVNSTAASAESGSTIFDSDTKKPNNAHPITVENAAETNLRLSLQCYLNSVPATVYGKDLLIDVKYISECFGYPVKIRRSEYRTPEGKVLLKAVLVCVKEKTGCLFRFVVSARLSGIKNNDGSAQHMHTPKQEVLLYGLQLHERRHSHEPSEQIMRRNLPAAALREARDLHEKSFIRCTDIVRYLEDKYNFIIDKDVLRRKLKWSNEKNSPINVDSVRLLQTLSDLQNEDPRTFYSLEVEENKLYCVCWCLPEWVEDYEKYGRWASIDAKALATVYDLPLVTICGRTNTGAVVFFFMGFLHSETSEQFEWFLGKFQQCFDKTPKLITMDQDSASMGAVRKIFGENTLIMLDEYHINTNQKTHVSNLAPSLGDMSLCREISNALFELRESRNEEAFRRRRRSFEEAYIPVRTKSTLRNPTGLPRWYRNLYYSIPETVVACYNRTKCGLRFLFQGSGYTESANSIFQNVIMAKNIKMADVPLYMRRKTIARREERKKANSTYSSALFNKLQGTNVTIDRSKLDGILLQYTSYCLQKFYTLAVLPSLQWRLVSHTFVRDEESGDAVLFANLQQSPSPPDLSYGRQPNALQRVRLEVENITQPSGTTAQPRLYLSRLLKATCHCMMGTTSGMPCSHITRLAVVMDEYRVHHRDVNIFLGGLKLDISTMFHPYWNRDESEWVRMESNIEYPVPLEEAGVVIDGENDGLASLRQARERRVSTFWKNGRMLYNQLHRRALSMGKQFEGLHALEKLLHGALESFNNSRIPTVEGPGKLLPRVEVSSLHDNGPLSIASLGNPNPGRVKGRGSRKRAKSFAEKLVSSKRRKRNSVKI